MSSNKNSSTDYEIFVKALYERILDIENHKNIEVKHNVKVTGRSKVVHQIDVLWKIESAGVTSYYCVECKKFSGKVKKSHISSFKGVLDDIGNASGIFVTTTGYQSGAIAYAKHVNIHLVTAKEIKKESKCNLVVSCPELINLELKFKGSDESILLAEYDQDKMQFFNSDGLFFCSVADFVSEIFHEKDGYYDKCLDGYYIKSSSGMLEAESLSYFYKRNIQRKLNLSGVVETASAIVEYVHDKEKRNIDL